MESRQVTWPTPRFCSPMWNSLKSLLTSSSTDLPPAVENSWRPSSFMLTPPMRAMRSAMAISRLVQVGDLNITVSARMAAASSPAILAEGMTPCS